MVVIFDCSTGCQLVIWSTRSWRLPLDLPSYPIGGVSMVFRLQCCLIRHLRCLGWVFLKLLLLQMLELHGTFLFFLMCIGCNLPMRNIIACGLPAWTGVISKLCFGRAAGATDLAFVTQRQSSLCCTARLCIYQQGWHVNSTACSSIVAGGTG